VTDWASWLFSFAETVVALLLWVAPVVLSVALSTFAVWWIFLRPDDGGTAPSVESLTVRIRLLERSVAVLERQRPFVEVRPDSVSDHRNTRPRTRYDEAAPAELYPRPKDDLLRSKAPSLEEITAQAAAALGSLATFREFTQRCKGRGYILRVGSETADAATGPDDVQVADLWVFEVGDTRLAYPGWNLRRSQSSLLADSGRLARERLGWLYTMQQGEPMQAQKPARVARHDWKVIERGVLLIPL
jgi:hypothetical protein